MMHRLAVLPVALGALFMALACGGRDGDGPGPGPGPDGGGPSPDAGEVIDLETYLRENGVIRLEESDGLERGTGLSSPDGKVRFYSARHEALFDLDLASHDVAMPVGMANVSLAVGENEAVYLVTDPMNRYHPLAFATAIPEADMNVEVDGWEALMTGGAVAEFDPSEDPFASAPFTVIGINVSISIQTILVGMVVGVVADVLGDLVASGCRFVAPTFAERCALVGEVVSLAANIVGGLFTGSIVSGWDIFEEVAGEVIDKVCEATGAAAVGYVMDPNDGEMRTRYRQVAQKYNHVLHRMETDPQPGQPSWAAMARVGAGLATTGQLVRNRYFQLYNAEGLDEEETVGYALGDNLDKLEAVLGAIDVDIVAVSVERVVLSDVMRAYLRITPYDVRYRVTRHRVVYTRTSSWSYSTEGEGIEIPGWASTLAGCVFSIVQGAEVEYAEGAMRTMHELETKQIVGATLDVYAALFDEIYARYWGGTIPMGMCLADEYEPNATWEQAVASPVPVTLGSPDVVELTDVNMCNGIGSSGTEEDWYAYFVGPIEFMVQARLMQPPMPVNPDQELCLDIYFYSHIYEIGGFPPDRITGVCGTVASEPATEPFGIRRTAGEEWSMMLLHVRPGPSATGVPVSYNLRFTP
jgi:hypothetical protein